MGNKKLIAFLCCFIPHIYMPYVAPRFLDFNKERPDAIKFQIPHLILKTIHCGAALYATLQPSNITGKKWANIARFIETLTDVPSYICKQNYKIYKGITFKKIPNTHTTKILPARKELDICPCSAIMLGAQSTSDIIKHIKECYMLQNVSMDISEQEWSQIIHKNYYKAQQYLRLHRICQCVLIVADYLGSLCTSYFQGRSFNQNPHLEKYLVYAKFISTAARFARRYFLKDGTFKLKGIHKTIDTFIPLGHHIIETARGPGKHFGLYQTREERNSIRNEKPEENNEENE